MPETKATCDGYGKTPSHPFTRRNRNQPADLCPACAARLRMHKLRKAREDARVCITCGQNAPAPGNKTCAECNRARVARGFKDRPKGEG